MSYEVEIRFCAERAAAAYDLLPFLADSLGPEKSWATAIWGRELYEAGRLLRIGQVPAQAARHYYLGYKGIEEGTFANIRQEWGEEITHGAANSAILAQLGITGDYATADAVRDALNAAGYTPFMDFSGVDRLGHVAALDVHTKLMRCPKILGEAVMVELELTAATKAEALAAEARLQQIATAYGLLEHLVRAEPTFGA
jgi:hypothetical protein